MMSKVSLDRIEQLLLGASHELRPAFAEGDPPVTVRDGARLPLIVAVWLSLVRPTESVGL
jgi:hypothetical protein